MGLLALDYRPARFADLVGQDSVRAVLQALVFAADMPAALLFDGPSGTGKTTSARILAAALNCEQPRNGDCCTTCATCTAIRAGRSLTVHELDAASNGGVDQIRALRDLTQFSTGHPWRVIVLDEAHGLTRQAAEALLKVLEEPPGRTVFVLVTTEPDKITRTVRSRAMPIGFRPVPPAATMQFLRRVSAGEGLELDEAVLAAIAEQAEGSVRSAVMLLDQARRAGVTTVADLNTLTGRSDLPHRILNALVLHDHAQARALLAEYFLTTADLAALLADMISDLQDRFANHTLSHQRMVAATKLLWDARSLLGQPARTARSQTEALITLLYAVFTDKARTETPILRVKSAPQEDSRRLDLAEVADLLSSELRGGSR